MKKVESNKMNSIENRVCERLNIEKTLKLYLQPHETITCKSTDISLGGMNLITDSILNTQYLGKDAEITIDQIDRIFNCKIVRVNQNQLAIEIDNKQKASFGMSLTENMFTH